MQQSRRHIARRWRMVAGSLAALGAGGALLVVIAPSLAGLVLLAVYCVPANSILPLPHEPGVLFIATFYAPLGVAIAATIGSAIGSISDYALVESAMRHPKIDRARSRGVIGWAIRWFQKAPFAIVFACSLVPFLPISVIRVLAPASRYSFRRYFVAGLLGRIPRFYALAYMGHAIQLPTWVLIAVTVLTLGVAIASTTAATNDRDQ
jgi:membrane protein YqaA with SNARE-associated domain